MKFAEEKICSTKGRIGNADQMWCWGSSTVVRVGENVFATHTRLVEERTGLSVNSMELYAKRGDEQWQREYYDEGLFQREPCPIMYLGSNLIGVTVNPADEAVPQGYPEVSTPLLYVFDISGPARLVRRITLRWDDPKYRFIEHSYRSSAVDEGNGDLFLSNMYYPPKSEGEHCYTLLDCDFSLRNCGKLDFTYRSCYHNICMKDGETYVFAVKDIVETVEEWKTYKKEMTGNQFDYALRVMYLLYSTDIRNAAFKPEKIVVDREDTCGRINNHDCAYDTNGDVLFVYSAVNTTMDFMRDKFFPGTKLDRTLEIIRLRKGEVINRHVIDRSEECDGKNPNTEYCAALHTMADGSLRLLWSKQGAPEKDAVSDGLYVCDPEGGSQTRVTDKAIGTFFISRRRLGAAPTDTADLVWVEKNMDAEEIGYAYMHKLKLDNLELTYMHGEVDCKAEKPYFIVDTDSDK